MPNPPKIDPARRHSRVGPVQLPAEGRQGEPPEWPLRGPMSVAERATWAYLWTLPQAVMWEKQNITHTVGRYCRLLVEAEDGATAAMHAVITALEDRLGMTPKAMRLLMWQVAEDEVSQKRTEAGPGARRRFKAVD